MIVSVVDSSVTSELRRAVLRPDWPVGSHMHGDGEPGVLNLAARDSDGAVVGACLLLPNPYPPRAMPDSWQLRGMATAESHRGQGVGSRLVDEAVRLLEARNACLLWCQARVTAIDFYANRGFVGEGEFFTHAETGIVHRLMYRELFGQAGSSTQ